MSVPSVSSIVAAVDGLEAEMVAMLHEIVSHPSLLNNEKSVQDYMFSKFSELADKSLAVKRVPIHRAPDFSVLYWFSAIATFSWGYIGLAKCLFLRSLALQILRSRSFRDTRL